MTTRRKLDLLRTSCLSLIVLIASLLGLPTMVARAMPGPRPETAPAPILTIDHEADLSAYNRVVLGGGSLSQSSAAALAGTAGGLAVRLGGTQPTYGQANFAPLTSPRYRFRFYLDPNGLAMSYRSILNVAALQNSEYATAWFTLRHRDGSYQIQANLRDDAHTVQQTAWYDISDGEHCFEFLIEYASSQTASDGRAVLWIDGTRKLPITGLDLFDLSKPAFVRLGSNWAIQDKTSGTYYLDEFVLRNDGLEIGPVSEPAVTPPTATATYTPTPEPTQTATPVPTAAGLVDLQHESSLAEYETVVHDANDLAQSAAAALGGTQGGLQATIDDDAILYGEKAFAAPTGTAYRFRHYLHPNALSMPNLSQITLAQVRGRANTVVTRLQYTDANGYTLYVRYADDNDAWTSLPATSISSAEHYVEVLVEFATGPSANDGRITYWVDDVRIAQHRGLDLYDKFRRPDHVRLGATWVSDPAIRGTLYLDEFVLRDNAEYIGPATTQPGAPPAVPTATPTAMPTTAPTATPTNTPTMVPPIPPTNTPTMVPPIPPTNTPTMVPPIPPTTAPTATPTTVPTATPTPLPTATPSSVERTITFLGSQAPGQTIREVSGGNFHHGAQGVTDAVDPVGALNIQTLNPRHVRVNMYLDAWERANDNSDPNRFNWSAFQESAYMSATFALMRERAAQGATFVASIWNVPDWMVENPQDTSRRRIKPAMYPELAESIAAWILYAQLEHGVTVDYISVNEPDIGVFISMPPQDAPPLIVETGKRLDEFGLQTRWLLADVSVLRDCQSYAATVWSHPEVRPYIGPLACHSYDQRFTSDQVLQDLGQFAQARGREFWVTEANWRAHLDPELYPTWENALNLSVAYSRLLKEGRATTLLYWQMLKNGFSTNDGTTPYPALDMLAQFKREIPDGSQILATSPNTSALYSLAVRSPSHVALFVINTDSTKQTVQIQDLPHGTYYHVLSNASGTLRRVGQINATGSPIQLTLNPESVNVLTTQPPAAQ